MSHIIKGDKLGVKATSPNKGGSKKDGKTTGSSAKSGTKRRPKSSEIFEHNFKVLRKKAAMRRKKLSKEV